MSKIDELRLGFETAYINGSAASNSLYRPQFVSNNHKEGKKVLSSVEDELLKCDRFQISVAFITMSGITPLLQTLKELENKNIPGEILTTNYLNFSEPGALKKLNDLSNITLKMYDVEAADEGFHTKGYIFRKDEIYRIIIGSSNITSAALTSNREWNTKLISTEQGEMAKEIVAEFKELWNSPYALSFDTFYENYKERYQIIKHQREAAKLDEITSIEKYTLQPNSMQVGFITNLKKILAAGEKRALLISATGTGKTYASAFAMRELGFRRVLFLVHRGQLARQTRKSYEKVFANTVSMGLVGAGYHEYEADYVFATVQTLNRDEHLLQYAKDAFDCIVLDEAHHVPADTYRKIMDHFTPKLWLGMTATPDKRDDNVEGRNVYEIFNYQIAYEIRLQQAMEENLLCPFHYFGITDLSMIGDEEAARDFNMLTSDERVRHIVNQADYYGYSGDKVKGLIFCSNIKETEELSAKFNQIINPATGKNFIECWSILIIPMAMVLALGFYTRRKKLAYSIFGVMLFAFLVGVCINVSQEMGGNPRIDELGIAQDNGAMEGKEVRLGAGATALWSIVTTVTSNGSVNGMHDSTMPLSGMMEMLNMQINTWFGGVGVGWMNYYTFIIITVFISGLMVGRTPEFLGKKVEAREMKIATIVALLHPFVILVFTALSSYIYVHHPDFVESEGGWLNNLGFHGLSEQLYEYTSCAANNGSGFEGLGDNTYFWNYTCGIVLILSRFIPIIGQVAIAGLLAQKKFIPESAGTLKTDTLTFGVMTFVVIFIIAALSFFPVHALSTIAEHLSL